MTKWQELTGFNPEEQEIVTWPESQEYIGCPEAELINDERGQELFGSSAYVIPKGYEPCPEEERLEPGEEILIFS